jgi:ring-1,2-phenylacetyl-CoA epoxidase subunit PaaD
VVSVLAPATIESIRKKISELPDPEIPVLTLGDLGIVRDVEETDDGHVVVTLTPTYSGCPAIDPIREDVESAVRADGYDDVEVKLALAPAWSTDWISEEGRRKLHEYGIAPPEHRTQGCVIAAMPVKCPRCGSADTREISRFGATPCQAHCVCNSCQEPFDRFKTI